MSTFHRAALIAGSLSALLFAGAPAHAVTIASWTFETTSPASAGPFAAEAGSGSASGFHAGAATFSSPAGNGSARSFSANTWAVGDYFQFSVSTLGLTGITIAWDQTGSNTGPRDFQLAYSIDNGSSFTNVASYSVINATWSSTVPVATTSFSYAVAGAANAASVLFRLADAGTASINGGTVAAAGTGRVDNVLISGVSAVPEPQTWALMLAGVALMGVTIRRRAPR